MTFKRIIQRVSFYPLKASITLIELVNTEFYMICLNKLLKWYGLKIRTSKYIHKSVKFDDFNKIEIGDEVVISFGVNFLTHDYSRQISYNVLKRNGLDFEWKFDNPFIGEIKIGANSFIGCRCLILPNTYIGKNCIIGAGSVVKGVVPDNSVVVGNPAKVIGKVEDFGEKWLKKHGIVL